MAGIDLIQDLGLVILAAAGAGWFCRRVGLPLIAGYIAVGILIGPHMALFTIIEDSSRIHSLAQVGLVFLVFQIGQGLRLQRLKGVGLPLILATIITVILMLNGSRLLGFALGWPGLYGLVLAGMLMVSSTAIIGKTLRENNALHSTFGQMALTITALDDLVAVIILTMLTVAHTSAMTAPGGFAGATMTLAAVMIAVLVIAILMLPPALRRLARNHSGDLQPLFIVGVLLLVALLSYKAGFSAAIGAFLLGSVVASTGHKAQVERSLGGLCEVFGALFFVAAGMLFDVKLLLNLWPTALLVFAFAMLWRAFSSTFALMLVGNKTGEAVRAGVSLTPIGEFSLIVALAAVSAAIVPDWFYALAVSVCLMSALTTPLLIRHPARIGQWIESRQPRFLRRAAGFYHAWIESFRHRQRSSLFWRLTGPRWLQVVAQALIVSGILVLAKPAYALAEKWLSPDWPVPHALPLTFWLAFLLILLAPMVALWRTIEALSMICAEAATRGYRHRARIQPAFEKMLHGAAFVAVLVWISMFIPYEVLPKWSLAALPLIAIVLALIFWRKLVRWHSRLEIDLRDHLQDPASSADTRTANLWQEHSYNWNLLVREHMVGEHTRAAGKSIRQLPIRQMFYCIIVGIDRHGHHLPNPEADTVLYPNDRLLLLGAESDLRQAERWLSAPEKAAREDARSLDELCLDQVMVPPDSRHIGKSLGELQLTRQLGIQVVGVDRSGAGRLTAGKLDTLSSGDRLLVLGTQEQIADMSFWLQT